MVISMVKQFSDSISFFFFFFFLDILKPREDKSIWKIGKILMKWYSKKVDWLFNLNQ